MNAIAVEVAVLSPGDAAASAAVGANSGAVEGPVVSHVWRDEDELQRLFEVEMPPAAYYEELGKDMVRRHGKVDVHLLEQLSVLEPFLDVCILSGFSLGAAKSRDNIAQLAHQFLGEQCGREGRDALDHHL